MNYVLRLIDDRAGPGYSGKQTAALQARLGTALEVATRMETTDASRAGCGVSNF